MNCRFFAAPYNAPYMQSGPNLQGAPAPDMYQNMTSQFRMSGAINQPPYNQQQPLNNQSTVLISSSSNSLMSATVKPSSQIGAIGTKVNAGNAFVRKTNHILVAVVVKRFKYFQDKHRMHNNTWACMHRHSSRPHKIITTTTTTTATSVHQTPTSVYSVPKHNLHRTHR